MQVLAARVLEADAIEQMHGRVALESRVEAHLQIAVMLAMVDGRFEQPRGDQRILIVPVHA